GLRFGGSGGRGGAGRLVGVEPKLFSADPDYVTSTEDLHRIDTLSVDKNPVRAGVAQDIPHVTGRDFGVTAGDFRRRNHDIAARVAAERDTRGRDLVLATVDERDHAPTGGEGRLPRRGRLEILEIRQVDAGDELRAATLPVISIEELCPSDL